MDHDLVDATGFFGFAGVDASHALERVRDHGRYHVEDNWCVSLTPMPTNTTPVRCTSSDD